MKKLFLCLIAVFMCLCHVNRVSAANYTAVKGDNAHGFNTYLLVPEDKDVPNMTLDVF